MSPHVRLQLGTNREARKVIIVYSLECDLFPDRWSPKFQQDTLDMEAVFFPRNFVNTYSTTLCHIKKATVYSAPQPWLNSRTFSIIFYEFVFLKPNHSFQHLISSGVFLNHIHKIWNQLKWKRYKIQNQMSACSVMYVGVKQKNSIKSM
jgi:hypothetical protein